MRFNIANDPGDSTRVLATHEAITYTTKDQNAEAHPIEIKYELAIRDLIIMTRYILGDILFIQLLENAAKGQIDEQTRDIDS
jgi:hypothetical protein